MSSRYLRELTRKNFRMKNLSILPLQSFDDYNTPEGGVGFICTTYFDALFGGQLDASIMAITVTSNDRSIAIKCMPHDEDEYDDIIFLPDWAREYLGNGTAQINKVDFDGIPRAQTIRARVIDNEIYHIDIKEQLEDVLSNFKFIQANIVLTVEIETMGGYPGQIWIEDVLDEDGAPCVGPALLGEEVCLDMAEPLEHAPEFDPVITAPVKSPVIASEPEPVASASEPEPLTIRPEERQQSRHSAAENLSAEEQRRIAREARLRRFA